jgi:hypothetical protein
MEIILLMVLVPIAVIEIGLLFYRGSHRVTWSYVFFSAFVRALIYSPCVIGAGLFALPVSTLCGFFFYIWGRFRGVDDSVYAFGSGIPLIVVFAIAFICSWIANRKILRGNDHVA